MPTCKKCGYDAETDSELNTHVLLNHPGLARSNSEDYSAEVSSMDEEEPRVEDKEQFGYR